MKNKIKTLDLTPSWSGILPALLAVLEDGNSEGREIAKDQLRTMAVLADKSVSVFGATKAIQDGEWDSKYLYKFSSLHAEEEKNIAYFVKEEMKDVNI